MSSSSGVTDPFAAAVSFCEAQMQQLRLDVVTQGSFEQMKALMQQKLWHQFTVVVLEYLLKLPSSASDAATIEAFYRNVVRTVQNQLHPLALARMTVLTTSHLSSLQQGGGDIAPLQSLFDECIAFLKEQLTLASSSAVSSARRTGGFVLRSAPSSYTEAILYLQCHHALLTMKKGTPSEASSMTATEMKIQWRPIYSGVIAPNKELVQDLLAGTTESTVDPATALFPSAMVYAAYYEMTMEYYQRVQPYSHTFYDHAILYLQYSNDWNSASTTSPSALALLATKICWSAILGEGIYNLLVLLEHPFLVQQFQDVTSPKKKWLWSLLHAMATSDYDAFTQLMTAPLPDSVPKLVPGHTDITVALLEKFTLIQLLHVIAQVPVQDRTLSFADLSLALHVPIEQLEWILMRALSVGLIRGSMDQCDQTLRVTYLQPQRVLTGPQLQQLQQHYQQWQEKVETQVQFLQKERSLQLTAA
jgi:PCI domain